MGTQGTQVTRETQGTQRDPGDTRNTGIDHLVKKSSFYIIGLYFIIRARRTLKRK